MAGQQAPSQYDPAIVHKVVQSGGPGCLMTVVGLALAVIWKAMR